MNWLFDCVPREALLFVTLNHSVYKPGTLVQLVGFGPAERGDRDPDEPMRPFIWGRTIFVRDSEPAWRERWNEEHWYFAKEDLAPLTPGALDFMAALS